jgi:hypothetical protein
VVRYGSFGHWLGFQAAVPEAESLERIVFAPQVNETPGDRGKAPRVRIPPTATSKPGKVSWKRIFNWPSPLQSGIKGERFHILELIEKGSGNQDW